MTKAEIIARRAELRKKIREHQIAIEHIQVDFKHLYLECTHPDKTHYTDISGVGCSDCPDCGWSG